MIQYPWLRESLFYYLDLLADKSAVQRVWVDKQFPAGVKYDCFDFAVNFLMDDHAFFDAPEKTIGYILEDESEMRAISVVVQAIDHLLKTHGTELTDAQYIVTLEWDAIVAAAKMALGVLAKKPVVGD